MTDPTDPASASRASKREQAVTAVFRAHHAALVRLAFLLRADDPEGAVSEAFEALFRRWGGLRNADANLAYLRKVVYNQTCSQFKKRQRERKTVDRIGSDPTTAPSVEINVSPHNDHQEVVDALDALPDGQREVLVLRFYDDLSYSEIAETLSIKIGTVKSHASRGMASLERILKNASARSNLEKLR